MPLVSEAPPTLKDKLIKNLRQIPEDILEKLYHLDIVENKGQMEYNRWLADRYRKYRDLSDNKDWLAFEIGGFRILMEIEE